MKVADYLPHRPPMLLIDEIVAVSAGRVVCKTTLRADCVFAKDGVVHASAMIEIVAQACAICAGAKAGGAPRGGMIIGCKEATFSVDSFAVGDELTIVAKKTLDRPALTTFTGTVSRGDTVCVTMDLSVVEAE